jgi:hypothetical protein
VVDTIRTQGAKEVRKVVDIKYSSQYIVLKYVFEKLIDVCSTEITEERCSCLLIRVDFGSFIGNKPKNDFDIAKSYFYEVKI